MMRYGCNWKGTLQNYNEDHKKSCYLMPFKDAFDILIKENLATINGFSECVANLTEQNNKLSKENEELKQRVDEMDGERKVNMKQTDERNKMIEQYIKKLDDKTKKMEEEMEKYNNIKKEIPKEYEWKTYKLDQNIVINGKIVSKNSGCSRTNSAMFFPAIQIQTRYIKYQIKIIQSGCYAAVGLATSNFNVNSDELGVTNESLGWELYPGNHNTKSDRRFIILNEIIQNKILTFEVNKDEGKVIICIDGSLIVNYHNVWIKNNDLFFTLTVCHQNCDKYELISINGK